MRELWFQLGEVIRHMDIDPESLASRETMRHAYANILNAMWVSTYDAAFKWADSMYNWIVENGARDEYDGNHRYLLEDYLLDECSYKSIMTMLSADNRHYNMKINYRPLEVPERVTRIGDELFVDFNSDSVHYDTSPKEFPVVHYRNRKCSFVVGQIRGYFTDQFIDMNFKWPGIPDTKYMMQIHRNGMFTIAVYIEGILDNVYSNCNPEREEEAAR